MRFRFLKCISVQCFPLYLSIGAYSSTIISESTAHSRIAAPTCINMVVHKLEEQAFNTALWYNYRKSTNHDFRSRNMVQGNIG